MKSVGRPLLNFLIVFSSLVLLPVAANAALIAIGNTYASSEVSTDRAAIHATNGSNVNFIGSLGQEGDPSKYTHTGGGNNFGQFNVNWLSANTGPDAQWLAVDLGGSYLLDFLNFFNFSTSGTANTNNGRGIQQGDIYYRTDSLGSNTHLNGSAFDSTGWTLLGTAGSQTFTLGPSNGSDASPDTIALGGITARYIAIDANSNFAGGSNYAGIGEVQLFGTAIPEPGKASLLFLAGAFAALRRRRE